MSDVDRREQALQDFVDGRIDERELRRRLGESEGAEVSEGLEGEVAAYRAVWAGLESEPPLKLDAEFARRTARAALTEQGTAVAAGPANPTGRWAGALAAAASTVTFAVALAAAVLLLPAAGVEIGDPLRRILRATATVPTALWGTLGTAAVLYVVDAAWGRVDLRAVR